MEEPQEQNIFSSEISNNNFNYNELDQLNNQELDFDLGNQNINQEILKSKDNTIKQLKRKIQAYDKNAQEQNLKLSDYDHLLVEYQSLNKNYTQLEQDLELLKTENMQLKEIINSKNQTILDFQGLFEASKSKFDLFNQTNITLKERIAELESKLKMYPNALKNNEDLNQKMMDYESKIERIKDEYNKREELYKIKLINQEKLTKNAERTGEEEINELKNEIMRIKNQLDLSKKKNDELLSSKKYAEEQFNNKLMNQEKENEKLNKMINNLKSNINDNRLLSKTETNKQKNEMDKLKEEVKNLYRALSEKDEQNTTLTEAINQANNAINQSEMEIETRTNTINGLLEEKEQLIKQLNEKQNDFNEYQNSSQQEIEMLHHKLSNLEDDRENLINELDTKNKEIVQLQDVLDQYEANGNYYLEEKKEKDYKFNNLAQAFQIKEQEYSDQIAKLKKINQKLQADNENLKIKYEKKVNLLTLQNNEATLRVRKLINTCITLKNYALSIQRNLNMNNMNNSKFLGNNTFQGQNYKGNIVTGLNNLVNQIDSKILNDDLLNQTY